MKKRPRNNRGRGRYSLSGAHSSLRCTSCICWWRGAGGKRVGDVEDLKAAVIKTAGAEIFSFAETLWRSRRRPGRRPAGRAGFSTSIALSPEEPSAINTYLSERATPSDVPSVSREPSGSGFAGNSTSTICSPALPSAR